MTKKPVRVLVVDDSALMRQFISDILNSDPRIEVCGTARDGQDALKQIQVLNLGGWGWRRHENTPLSRGDCKNFTF